MSWSHSSRSARAGGVGMRGLGKAHLNSLNIEQWHRYSYLNDIFFSFEVDLVISFINKFITAYLPDCSCTSDGGVHISPCDHESC